MANQQVAINQHQKPIEGYQGALVYRQEYGHKHITMMIDLRTPDERSRVTSWAYDFDIPEEAEHLPAGSLFAAVDLYHFPATDGMEIELTIRSQVGEDTAHYIVETTGIEEHSSFLWLDVMKARDRLRQSLTLPLLRAAEKDGLTILWIAVSASMYKFTEVDAFQPLNDPDFPLDSLSSAYRNKELVRISERIKRIAGSH